MIALFQHSFKIILNLHFKGSYAWTFFWDKIESKVFALLSVARQVHRNVGDFPVTTCLGYRITANEGEKKWTVASKHITNIENSFVALTNIIIVSNFSHFYSCGAVAYVEASTVWTEELHERNYIMKDVNKFWFLLL